MQILIVTNPFGGHEKGHRITDPAEIEEILAGEHAHDVVRADHDVEPGEDDEDTDHDKPTQSEEN